MRKHIWFVIEGDNGAGKDTLADRLLPDGWFLASRSPHVVTAKEQASHLTGVDRVDAFLLYNQMCAKLATKHPSRSVLVRYWPSTLAAGFADSIFEWAEFETRVEQCVRELPTPELILFLQCGLDARHNDAAGYATCLLS
ncbi:MAG: hypothetical protein IH991_00165 [Planctomycetes bacterium]|nr:hypothetical protein [Planctomycetota bacterium]